MREALCSETSRLNPLTLDMKVIITLRYLDTGKMHQCSSDDLGPSQSSISRTIDGLPNPNALKRFIYFPVTKDTADKKIKKTTSQVPLMGHIRIVAPK